MTNGVIADLQQEIKELKNTVALLNNTMDTRLEKLEGKKKNISGIASVTNITIYCVLKTVRSPVSNWSI